MRFDWGADGAAAIAADADIVVWVDALPPARTADEPPTVPTSTPTRRIPASPPPPRSSPAGSPTASAVARWILDEQVRLGRRRMVAIVAAGGAQRIRARTRFAVEDLLAAGAIIDALAALGIDYASPEAAAACAAFTGLARCRRAPAHGLRVRPGTARGGAQPRPRSLAATGASTL